MNPHDPTGSGLDRREFLKVFGLTAAATGLVGPTAALAKSSETLSPLAVPAGFPKKLQSPPKLKKNPTDEKYWRSVRDAFALPNNYIHMNTGTTGSQPAFSLNNLAVYNLYKSQDPKDWQANLNADFPDLFPFQNGSATTARQKWVADVYGANPDEIVLSYNTTDACNLIFAGTPWQEGDRIITTSFEHPALAGPIAWARDYHGVEVMIIDIPSNFTSDISIDDVLGWFEAKLKKSSGKGNTQYLAFSEIFYKNGLRMPVAELCALARKYGAYTIVDTAHGWGMLPIDCHAYGADFIAGAGHKWLCGGPGTGICYVRKSDADAHPLPPFALGNFFLYGNPFQVPSSFYENRNWNPSLYMQFRGESNTPALFAMTDTLSFFEQVGIQEIYERGVALGNHLKGQIENKWGSNALWVSPGDPAFATALTSFNPFAAKDSSADYATMVSAINTILANLAAETPKIYIRSVTWRSSQIASADDRVGFRVSTHGVYNDFDEVDYVFERLVHHIKASNLPTL